MFRSPLHMRTNVFCFILDFSRILNIFEQSSVDFAVFLFDFDSIRYDTVLFLYIISYILYQYNSLIAQWISWAWYKLQLTALVGYIFLILPCVFFLSFLIGAFWNFPKIGNFDPRPPRRPDSRNWFPQF